MILILEALAQSLPIVGIIVYLIVRNDIREAKDKRNLIKWKQGFAQSLLDPHHDSLDELKQELGITDKHLLELPIGQN